MLIGALGPGDAWTAWSLDPLVLGGLVAAAWIWHRGGRDGPTDRWRAGAYLAGLAAVGVALVSPVEALAGVLASAHMVQHVLLTLVAAPLVALARPSHRLLRGAPLRARRAVGRWRRRTRLTPPRTRRLRHPALAWGLATVTLWLWHARSAYDLAVQHELAHVAEHLTLLGTALFFWSVIVGLARSSGADHGLAVLLVFAMGMQGVFLSALLTFAQEPWYDAYLDTTQAFGLTPLADQQLAGVILWIPGGLVYAGAGLTLLLRWLRTTDDDRGERHPARRELVSFDPGPPPARR